MRRSDQLIVALLIALAIASVIYHSEGALPTYGSAEFSIDDATAACKAIGPTPWPYIECSCKPQTDGGVVLTCYAD